MQDMSQYGIKAVFSALSFGSLGMIVPSPGGIGSYQYAVQQVLLLYGISAEKGLSLGMLIWFAQTGIIIIFGTISFICFLYSTNQKMKNPDFIHSKISQPGWPLQAGGQWKFLGKKAVFTNGCFDMLHQGHIASLMQAAKEADICGRRKCGCFGKKIKRSRPARK